MIKAILIDDEPLSREIVRSNLKSFPQISVVDECNDGYEGIKSIMQHKPDLIFLDIQMPKINGFEMLELVEESPSVIFTTAFDEFAIKAFEANAVDYLLKPFSEQRFKTAIENEKEVVVLDVRTPQEVAQGSIKGAIVIDFMANDFADKINREEEIKKGA